MSPSRTRFIGMAVHKDAIAVAYVAQAHGAEGTDLGALGTRQGDSAQLIRTMPATATHLIGVYEAGPGGDWRSRYGMQKGDDGGVVAPSLLPHTPGDRVTTDRRDAGPRARLARSGALTAVDVPTVEADAMRARTRAREEALSALKDATGRLHALVLRQDRRDVGRATGGPAHRRWRSAVVCPTPAPPRVWHAYGRAVQEPTARLPRLEQARQEHVHAWRVPPVVEALPAVRGGPCPVAGTRGAALGARPRVDPPRARRTGWGLMPAAYSAGEPRRPGSITTAGHPQARRALVDGAGAARDPAKGRRPRPRRRAPPPPRIQALRWKAQGRRCQRARRRVSRGKPATVVTVAMARARAGVRWAMAREVPGTPEDPQRAGIPPPPEKVPHVHRQRRRPGVGSPSAAG
jgi:transposase